MLTEITRLRLRAFRSRRLSYYSLLLLCGLFVLSWFSELIANDRPIILHYRDAFYFPIFQNYSPRIFGQQGTLVVDFRVLEEALGAEDWSLWPPVRWGPFESDGELATFPAPPDDAHWLGSDDKGRDLLVRLLYGFRLSMVFALTVWALSFSVGISLGALQGFYGGWVDFYGQRLVEIWRSIPVFYLILILIVIFSPTLLLLILVVALFGWTTIAQYQRAEFLNLRRRDFVEAARALGASNARIIILHILPNALTPVVTFTPFTIAGGITAIAALDYLGFGVPPPTPSWGELLRQALTHFTTAWWIATFTVGSMFFVLLLLVLINEGVREAFDPRRGRG